MLGEGEWSTASAAATGVLWLRRRGAAPRRSASSSTPRSPFDGGRGGPRRGPHHSGRRARRAAGPRHEDLPLPRAVRSENDRAAARRAAERHRRRLHLRRAGLGPGPARGRRGISPTYLRGDARVSAGGRTNSRTWTGRHGSKERRQTLYFHGLRSRRRASADFER